MNHKTITYLKISLNTFILLLSFLIASVIASGTIIQTPLEITTGILLVITLFAICMAAKKSLRV